MSAPAVSPVLLEDNPAEDLALVEAQLVSHATLDDFVVDRVREAGSVAIVFEGTCRLPGLPTPLKRYAIKVMIGGAQSDTDVADMTAAGVAASAAKGVGASAALAGVPGSLAREWLLSNALPPHPNVARVLRVGCAHLGGLPPRQVLAALSAGAPASETLSAKLAEAAAAASSGDVDADADGTSAASSRVSSTLAFVLRELPDAQKVALATALAAAGVPPSSGSAAGAAAARGPALAFAVSECAAASLASARGSMPTPMPFPLLFALALQLARGLAHASSFRLVHRDLHPGNVLLFPLAAGGGAAHSDGSTASGSLAGILGAGSSGAGAAPAPGGGSNASVLLAGAGFRAALGDWGAALRCSDDSLTVRSPALVGGALAYLPPEVLVAAARGVAAAASSAAAAAVGGAGDGASAGSAASSSSSSPPVSIVPYGKSDVWGLAALLHTAATGAHPFPGYPAALSTPASHDAVAAAAAGGVLGAGNPLLCPPTLPSDVYPLYFRELLAWALRPHPAQRVTLRAFTARLEDLATGAVPRPLPTRLFPWIVGPLAAHTADALATAASAAAGGAVVSPSAAAGAGAAGGAEADPESWGIVNVRSPDGVTASVPVFLGPPAAMAPAGPGGAPRSVGAALPEATFGDVLAAALELLPLRPIKSSASTGDAVEYALLHSGRRVDSGVPVRLLPHIAATGALIAGPVSASVPPHITVPGYGVLAPARPVHAAPDSAASALLLAAAGSGVAIGSLAGAAGGAAGFAGAGMPVAGGAGMAPLLPGAAGMPAGAAGVPAGGIAGGLPVGAKPGMPGGVPPGAVPAGMPPAGGLPAGAVPPGAAGAAGGAGMGSGGLLPAGARPLGGAAVGGAGAAGGAGGAGMAPPPVGSIPPAAVAIRHPGQTPMFAFAETAKSAGIALSHAGTVASTRDKWGTVLLAAPLITERSHGNGAKYSFSVHVLHVEPSAGCAVGFADVSAATAAAAGGGGLPFDPTCHNLGAHPGSWAYSKTGKVSNGKIVPPPPPSAPGAPPPPATVWAEYGESFSAGDIITCEVEPAAGRVRFFRNGVPQVRLMYFIIICLSAMCLRLSVAWGFMCLACPLSL